MTMYNRPFSLQMQDRFSCFTAIRRATVHLATAEKLHGTWLYSFLLYSFLLHCNIDHSRSDKIVIGLLSGMSARRQASIPSGEIGR
jgi:uncharacterized membrane protein